MYSSYINIYIYIELPLSNMQKIMDFMNSTNMIQTNPMNNNLKNDIDYDNHVIHVVNDKIKKDTYHLAVKYPILQKIMAACTNEDLYGLTDDQIDALESFENHFHKKNKRYSKGEKSDCKNEVKLAIETVIRNAWKNYNLFDSINPRQNFKTTGILTLERFIRTVDILANMIVDVLFISKQKLNEVALLSSESNIYYIQ